MPRIVIIGGGIGGLSLAVGLKNNGIPSIVCERNANIRSSFSYPVPADLYFLPQRAYEHLQHIGVDISSYRLPMALTRRDYQPVGWRKLSEITDPKSSHIYAVSRNALLETLLSYLQPESVIYSKVLRSFQRAGEGRIEAVFEDGSKEVGDFVDGAESKCRQLITDEGACRPTGVVSIQAVCTDPMLTASDRLRQSVFNAYTARGQAFVCGPAVNGLLRWSFMRHHVREDEDKEELKRQLIMETSKWMSPVPEILPAETLSVHWHYYAPLSTLLLSPKEKRVILIGDAAHLTPPVGTVENDGAAAAIEDAVLLTRKLKNFASQAHLSELEASSLRGQFHTETVARNLGRSWRLRRREKQMVSSGFLALMKQTGRRLLFRFGGSYHQ